ncbi:MAG TPA: hypothetical protein VFV34_15595 [Blastocatellia bacterium]|nr:hypothetical protein [Blastocatellia bacterium]
MAKRAKPAVADDMFDSLVLNAIDFLERSTEELEEHPKYAMIHFSIAIELLTKARLLTEHWALIFEKPQEAHISKFQKGDFKSVGTEQAISRLEAIVGEVVDERTKRVFKQIRTHRNSLVHFFHPSYASANTEAVETVVSEQCAGWYYMYKLLKEAWRDPFTKYLGRIEGIDARMRANRTFLNVRFNICRPQIEEERRGGAVFIECPSCGHEACRWCVLVGPLIKLECLVCRIALKVLKVSCPNCKATIVMTEGQGQCNRCNTPVAIDRLLDQYVEAGEGNRCFCAQCFDTVYPTVGWIGDRWVFFCCVDDSDEFFTCDDCGRTFAGDLGPLCRECEYSEEHQGNSGFGHAMW